MKKPYNLFHLCKAFLSIEKDVLKNFTKFKGLFCEFCEVFKKNFFTEHPWTTASRYMIMIDCFTKLCVCGIRHRFEDFFEDVFCMCGKKGVCEIALIIRGSTDYQFSAAIFIELIKFRCEAFTIIMGCMHIQTGDRMMINWRPIVFTPDK